jgi:hypothetical protein
MQMLHIKSVGEEVFHRSWKIFAVTSIIEQALDYFADSRMKLMKFCNIARLFW